MASPGRPGATSGPAPNHASDCGWHGMSGSGSRKRPSRKRMARTRIASLRVASLFGAVTALVAIGCIPMTDAVANAGCAGSETTSADGSVVHGSPCADAIVVTSPLVRRVDGGGGNDVIYANPNVKEIYGGAGSDIIHGDLPEATSEAGIPYEPGIEYEPTRGGRGIERITFASGLGAHKHRGPLATASNVVECQANPCFAGDGSQQVHGGPGSDIMFGERGNDTLYGEGGADALYGGIGDDKAYGGEGGDLLSGGLGTDVLDGENGSDLVRGDGTTDVLKDTGTDSGAVDTVSFATAVTPGFHGLVAVDGFPTDWPTEERGVEVRLDGNAAGCGVQACNNDARLGGGGDVIVTPGFENVIGSPFADHIVGSAEDNRIDGGGGADVIEGGAGNDRLFGGADGDLLKGGPGEDRTYPGEGGGNNCTPDVEIRYGCTGSAEGVQPRDRSSIEVGFMSPPVGGLEWESLYMLGSESNDSVSVSSSLGHKSRYVVFTAEPGSALFDTSASASSPNCTYAPTEVKCTVSHHLDTLTLAGIAGDDWLSIAGHKPEWEGTTTPVLLGGEGNDELVGSSQTEDVLVDGDGYGNDRLSALGRDDALLNNEGFDLLQGGRGSDLLVSSTTCEGDELQGAESKAGDPLGVNSASWAPLPGWASGVVADLATGTAGATEYYVTRPATAASSAATSGPFCYWGTVDQLRNIDDLEGSNQSDSLAGDSGSNNLLGRRGEDELDGRGGPDSIEAQDGEHDTVDGGAGPDLCSYDKNLDSVSSCGPE
jgi:Ca2+-binding RTX toxin-like protein